jgi:hypothetical protein
MNAEEKRHLVKFFINKFEAIPEDRWCSGVLQDHHGRKCALGHTFSLVPNNETEKLCELFAGEYSGWHTVAMINNGDSSYRQPTEKARILAALHDKLKECL